jgi:hypothetical protein
MARTLQQLKESVECLIEQQGEDAPVAAFIFTQEDVFNLDEDGNPEHIHIDNAGVVLNELEENDWIYEQIFDAIANEMKDVTV